jgi:hypothetical protein
LRLAGRGSAFKTAHEPPLSALSQMPVVRKNATHDLFSGAFRPEQKVDFFLP